MNSTLLHCLFEFRYLIFYLFSTYMNHKTINRFLYYTITVFINLLNSNRSNSQARPNKG